MEYKGKIFGRIGKKYFDTGKTTDDWDRMENMVENLKLKVDRKNSHLSATSGQSDAYKELYNELRGEVLKLGIDSQDLINGFREFVKAPCEELRSVTEDTILTQETSINNLKHLLLELHNDLEEESGVEYMKKKITDALNRFSL